MSASCLTAMKPELQAADHVYGQLDEEIKALVDIYHTIEGGLPSLADWGRPLISVDNFLYTATHGAVPDREAYRTAKPEQKQQIMQMIAQSAPRHWLDHPIDWYRPTWPQPPRETPREPQYGWGPPSVPSGPWCFDHDRWMKAQEDLGHCKDHTNKQTLGIFKDAKEVTSFEQVADFLWPIGVDNPKKEETDEQS